MGGPCSPNKKPALTRAKVPFVPEELYFVRCLKSGFRFRPRKSDSDEPKVFECTNQCGQLFCRKGDWGRHERLNFEEWPCPHCGKVLSRCEHLRAHFKDAHPVEKDISKYQKRVFLTARQRPCGFCGSTLTDWSAWLAHVASHFEEHREGGARAMSNWTDYRFLGEVEAEIVVTAPEEAMPGTMTASETQIDHVTSPALWREAETLDEQNEKDEKSARQVKHDGRDRYRLGRIGNHYNDSEPHFASVSEVCTPAGTSRRKERRPSFKDDQSNNPTHRHAGRHKPERQASLYGGLSSSSSSDFLSGRHPNAERNKTEPPASDILGHRDTSDEDRDYTISNSTRAAALSRHQPTAYVSPRHGSSRHSRPSTHTTAFTERERKPYLNPPSKATVDTTDEEEDLPTPRPIERERKPYIAQPGGGKNYDQTELEKVMSSSSQRFTMDRNKPSRSASILSNSRPPYQKKTCVIPITVHQRGPPSAMENGPMSADGMPAALSRHQSTAYVSPRHDSSRLSRPPTPPMPAGRAGRRRPSAKPESSDDELAMLYIGHHIHDSEPESEPESAKAKFHRDESEPPESRYASRETWNRAPST